MLNQKKFLIAHGKKISIERLGKNHKEVVVIVPGYNQSKGSRVFKALALDLAKDFDCISVDMRGHGESEGAYTFGARETEDLKVVLDYAHYLYKRVHVMAFSMGGFIAVNEAAKFNNVSSLVLVSSPMSFRKIEGRFLSRASMRVGAHSVREGDGMFTIGNPFLKKEDPIDNIGKIKVPVLFIHGTNDPIVNIRHSKAMYKNANLPKKIVIFEEGNHAEELYRQFPEEFMRVSKEFFKEGYNNGSSEQSGGVNSRLCETVGYIK